MNILVTGGAGFIGSTLVDELLKANNSVVVFDNFCDYYSPEIKECNISDHMNNSKFKLYKGDIENKSELTRAFSENSIDCVVHIAARAGVRPSIENPDLYFKTNVLGTINVLETMREFGVKKIVFASSSSVYGNCTADIFSEDLDVSKPISPYAASKLSCEHLCYTYSNLYNINAVCLRFFTVYGPKQRPDLAISKFVRLISQGQPIPVFGDGTTRRDYTFVEDIVSGIKAAINYDKTPYEIINIGGGNPVSLMDMISSIERCLGKKAIIDRKPMQLGDVDKTVADISKAKRLLNYAPKVTFDEGIKKFVDWLWPTSQTLDRAS